jgi:hypothetical protein
MQSPTFCIQRGVQTSTASLLTLVVLSCPAEQEVIGSQALEQARFLLALMLLTRCNEDSQTDNFIGFSH